MENRIPLTVKDKLRIISLISCDKLRIRMRPINFVVDTGSSESYLSLIDISKLQISLGVEKLLVK